jgi:hypothetical protein
MAYRPLQRSSSRKVQLSKVLPLWTTANTETNNLMVSSCFSGMGMSDLKSYTRKLSAAIIFCVFVGACIGLANSGLKGLIVGSLLGFAAPAGVIFLAVTLLHIAVYLFAYCLVWTLIVGFLWWLLHS